MARVSDRQVLASLTRAPFGLLSLVADFPGQKEIQRGSDDGDDSRLPPITVFFPTGTRQAKRVVHLRFKDLRDPVQIPVNTPYSKSNHADGES